MQTMTVVIYHNVDKSPGRLPFFDAYAPNQAVAPVFTYAAEIGDALLEADYRKEAERAFRICNGEAWHDETERALSLKYYANRLRSLSVGDVVQIGPVALAVASAGTELVSTGFNVQPDPFMLENWRKSTDHKPELVSWLDQLADRLCRARTSRDDAAMMEELDAIETAIRRIADVYRT